MNRVHIWSRCTDHSAVCDTVGNGPQWLIFHCLICCHFLIVGHSLLVAKNFDSSLCYVLWYNSIYAFRSYHDWLNVANDAIAKLGGLLGRYFLLFVHCMLSMTLDCCPQRNTFRNEQRRRELCWYQFHNYRAILEIFCVYCGCFRGLTGVRCGTTKFCICMPHLHPDQDGSLFCKHCIVITWVFQSLNELFLSTEWAYLGFCENP